MSWEPGHRELRWAVGALLASAAAAVALAVAWALDADVQIQGLLLGASFLLLGGGLGLWANRLTGGQEETEPRPSLAPEPEAALGATEAVPPVEVDRRGVLVRASLVAGGALGAAALLPLRALGPSPGRSLLETSWRDGMRLVTSTGSPVRSEELPLDGFLTAFPEDDVDSADGQIVVVRVPPELLELPSERSGWAPDGMVAYSKVCTHAGCPVGLYSADTRELLCPCHQSAFDVLVGAEPRGGPAVWPLPQLPLQVGDDGVVRAAGALSDPVGPGWWRSGE